MLKVKLEKLHSLNAEICRLEKIGKQVEKSQDFAKKKACRENLAQCRKERNLLRSEELLDKVPLSKEEKVMARGYYYDGKTWGGAFCDVLKNLPDEMLEKFKKDEEKEEEEEVEEQEGQKKKKKQTKQQNYFDKLKKSIERKINSTFIDIADKES